GPSPRRGGWPKAGRGRRAPRPLPLTPSPVRRGGGSRIMPVTTLVAQSLPSQGRVAEGGEGFAVANRWATPFGLFLPSVRQIMARADSCVCILTLSRSVGYWPQVSTGLFT